MRREPMFGSHQQVKVITDPSVVSEHLKAASRAAAKLKAEIPKGFAKASNGIVPRLDDLRASRELNERLAQRERELREAQIERRDLLREIAAARRLTRRRTAAALG